MVLKSMVSGKAVTILILIALTIPILVLTLQRVYQDVGGNPSLVTWQVFGQGLWGALQVLWASLLAKIWYILLGLAGIVRVLNFFGVSKAENLPDCLHKIYPKSGRISNEKPLTREEIIAHKIIGRISSSGQLIRDVLLECCPKHKIFCHLTIDQRSMSCKYSQVTFDCESMLFKCSNVVRTIATPFIQYCKSKNPHGIAFLAQSGEVSTLIPVFVETSDSGFQHTLETAQTFFEEDDLNNDSYWKDVFPRFHKGDTVIMVQPHLSSKTKPVAERCYRGLRDRGLNVIGFYVFFKSVERIKKTDFGGRSPNILVTLNLNPKGLEGKGKK